jgi:hypothetical protein
VNGHGVHYVVTSDSVIQILDDAIHGNVSYQYNRTSIYVRVACYGEEATLTQEDKVDELFELMIEKYGNKLKFVALNGWDLVG